MLPKELAESYNYADIDGFMTEGAAAAGAAHRVRRNDRDL